MAAFALSADVQSSLAIFVSRICGNVVGIGLCGLSLTRSSTPGRRCSRYTHALYAVLAVLVGFQAVLFALFTKVFAITEGLLPEDPRLNKLFKVLTLETGLAAGILLQMAGAGCVIYSVMLWNGHGFGPMDPTSLMRLVACAFGLVLLGVETALASFFFSILGLARK
jgi:hypothetical protein